MDGDGEQEKGALEVEGETEDPWPPREEEERGADPTTGEYADGGAEIAPGEDDGEEVAAAPPALFPLSAAAGESSRCCLGGHVFSPAVELAGDWLSDASGALLDADAASTLSPSEADASTDAASRPDGASAASSLPPLLCAALAGRPGAVGAAVGGGGRGLTNRAAQVAPSC